MGTLNRRNPTAYLAILNNNPNGSELFEIDDWIVQVQGVIDHPDVNPAIKALTADTLSTLKQSRDDIAAGRQNAFWNGQKIKAQKGIDDLIAEVI